jgi:hypothetical protein
MGKLWKTLMSVLTNSLQSADNLAVSLSNITEVAVHTSAQYKTEALKSLQDAEKQLSAP